MQPQSLAHARMSFWFKRMVRAPRPLAHGPRRWAPTHLAAGTVLAIALLSLVSLTVDASSIVYARTLPAGVVHFFNELSDFGKSAWFLWPLGIALLAIAVVVPFLTSRGALVIGSIATRLAFLFAAIAFPGLVTTVTKMLIGRARPFVGGAADPYLFNPFIAKAAWWSFPSGHATTVFSVAVAFGALFPRIRPLLWIYALVIIVSRVVVTAHHPSDVIGGALVGGFGALIVRNYFAARSLGFSIGPRGEVHATRWPSLRRIKTIARAPIRA